jgi:hypothetical protein
MPERTQLATGVRAVSQFARATRHGAGAAPGPILPSPINPPRIAGWTPRPSAPQCRGVHVEAGAAQ